MASYIENRVTVAVSSTFVLLLFGWIGIAYATEEYAFVKKWGTEGSSDSQFQEPVSVTIDPSGNVYVVDSGNQRIQKFDSDGKFITKWGSQGSGDGQFHRPYSIAIDSLGKIYVADLENYLVQKFDSDGKFITKWGSPGSGNGELNGPTGIAVDSNDNVYVAEIHNSRIQKFDSDGKFITKWGSPGSGNGQFANLEDVAIDSSNNIYAADYLNQRIQKFDSDGKFITKWGTQGSGNGEFGGAIDVAVDSSDKVYVVDYGNHRIEKFDKNGNFITKWGSYGTSDGQFRSPVGVALDLSSNVYVADYFNDRIQVFAKVTDTILPETMISSIIDSNNKNLDNGTSTASNSITFIFEGTDNEGIQNFKCELDENIPGACTPPKTYSNLADGKHTFSVFAVDTSLNEDPTPEIFQWTVDTAKPTVKASPLGGTYNTDKSVTVTASEDAVIYYTTDGSDPTISSQHGPSPLSGININNEGQTLLKFFAVDLAGNIGNVQTETYTIDKTAPVVTVPSSDLVVQATSSTGAVVTFSATAHDNIDGDVTAACTPTSGSIFPIGNTNVNCNATDKAGNTGMASFNVVVKEPPKPAAEPTSLSLGIKPNKAVAIGQDYSLSGRLSDGASGRKLVGGQAISFTSEPFGVISVPIIKTDTSGKFTLTGLKAPVKVGTYKIVAHFSGSSNLQPSDSNPILLKVEKEVTSLKLQVKGGAISGASLNGDLTDSVTHKGISSQTISFTTSKPGLVIHDVITDSKGKYKISLPAFECGTTNIQIQSHFVGTDGFKPADSNVSVLKIPRCSTSQQFPSSSFETHTPTNSSKG